ncbi:MAG: hypothetical protein FWF09_05895, partial [Bacteroidales bacterium]|nr:hypothetical protein [Bacteroidales bacterium]
MKKIRQITYHIVYANRCLKMGLLAIVLLCSLGGKAKAQCNNWGNESTASMAGVTNFCVGYTYRLNLHIWVNLDVILAGTFDLGVRWGDGAEVLIDPATLNTATAGTAVYTSLITHVYPIPTPENTNNAECQFKLNTFIRFRPNATYASEAECADTDGTLKVTVWTRDNEGFGVISEETFLDNKNNLNEYLVCEGKPFDITFRDESRLACNLVQANDNDAYRKNEEYRRTVFTYGIPGSNIADVYVGGVMYDTNTGTQVTNNTGGLATGIPAGGHPGDLRTWNPVPTNNYIMGMINPPSNNTWTIWSNGENTVADQVFIVQLNSWNICNPYPDNPSITTARIRIVRTPPKPEPRVYEFCHTNNTTSAANLSTSLQAHQSEAAAANMGGGVYRWYRGETFSGAVINGGGNGSTAVAFNPGDYGVNTSTPGTYHFWVTY